MLGENQRYIELANYELKIRKMSRIIEELIIENENLKERINDIL